MVNDYITLDRDLRLLNMRWLIGRLDYQPLFGKGARAPSPNSRLNS